ncbi:Cysteine and histidine-rich domain-containing protein 1 [Dirofilaria immitis]|nr:Cysteine and histidine-rich domain-containing protein 1 [Dirofilaria immitis]
MEEKKLLYCYNKGCGTKFDPDDNKDDSCLYHPGAPYFHDAYKIWSCCNQKSTDFSTWLSLKGCTRGQHNNQKTTVETKPEKLETKIKTQTPEEYISSQVIIWNGLNKPAARHNSLEIMRAIKSEVTDGALKAIERFKSEIKEETESDVHIGVSCKNPGCEKNEKCMYHSGVAIFHEGMKYWSCCEKKTSDFSVFLGQKGCTVGDHCWTKARKHVMYYLRIQAERVDKIREDWFSGGAMPESCKVESNGLILQIKIVHGFGAKETQLNYELFGRIDVDASKVIIGERKLELILKQEDIASWPRLTYDPKSVEAEMETN